MVSGLAALAPIRRPCRFSLDRDMSDLWHLIHASSSPRLSVQEETCADGLTALSLREVARRHADEHRWLESERIGRDLGPVAYLQWRKRYWRTFCRWRYLEHLLGTCRYAEFPVQRYNTLRWHSDWTCDHVMEFALRRLLRDDREQLELYYEAPAELPRQRLTEVLSLLGFNDARVSPPDWLLTSD